MRKILSVVAALVVILGVVVSSSGGAAQAANPAGDLVIAVVGPMTGDNAQYGKLMRSAVELAADEINKAGGINGRNIKIQAEDDKMQPQDASVVAQKLSFDKTVLAVVGHFSSTTSLAAVPVYTQNKLVAISPSSTSPKLSGISPYFFRTCITDDPNGAAGAEYLVTKLGKKNIVIMHALSDGPTAYTNAFKATAEKLGAKILAVMAHEDSAKDFTADLTKVKSLNPDGIAVPSFYTPAALIAKQAAELNLRVQFIGNDGEANNDLIAIGGSAVEGMVFGEFFHPDLPGAAARQFTNGYRAKYNADPETYGAGAYDGLKIIAEAIRRAGPDRQAIRDYIEGIGTTRPAFPGVTGPIKFDAKHDVLKPLVFVTVKNGKIVLAPTQ